MISDSTNMQFIYCVSIAISLLATSRISEFDLAIEFIAITIVGHSLFMQSCTIFIVSILLDVCTRYILHACTHKNNSTIVWNVSSFETH